MPPALHGARPADRGVKSPHAASLFADLMAVPPPVRREFLQGLTGTDLQQVLREADTELGTPYGLWRDDPVGFVIDVLGDSLWSIPKRILSLLPATKRTVVPSCFGSSKTFSAARAALWMAYTYPVGTAQVVTIAPLWRQVIRQMWPEIRAAHNRAGLPGTVDQAQLKLESRGGLDTVVAYGIAAAPYNEAAVQGIHCFDSETDLLTDEGWKPFPEVRGDERVLTLPPESDVAEWGPITEVIREPFDGYLNLHDGDRVNFCVTDNHRFLVRGRGKEYGRHGRITRTEAQKIKDLKAAGVSVPELAEKYRVSKSLIYQILQGRRDHALTDRTSGPRWKLVEYADLPETFIVRRTNTWGGDNPDTIVLEAPPRHTRKAERWEFDFGDWCEFLGWFVSEGWTSQRQTGSVQVGISQKQGEKYEEICALLERMGLTGRRSSHDVRVTSDAIGLWLREHCGVGSFNKRIPACVKEARPEMIRRFLDAFGKGDGCAHTHAESRRYITSSPRLADDLQEVMAKIGTARKKRVMHPAGSTGKITRDGKEIVFTRDKPTFMLNEAGRPADSDVHKRNVRRVRYTGKVYCVSTPHQTIMVRRNGCPMWSGNSRGGLLLVVDEAGGIAHTIGRNLAGLLVGDGARMLAIGNPPTDDEGSWFEGLCTNTKKRATVIPISAYATPNLSGERAPRCRACPEQMPAHSLATHLVDRDWVDEVIADHGDDAPYVQSKVHARFPQGGSDRVIPTSWVAAARDAEDPEPGEDVVRVCDLGLEEEFETWPVRRGSWVRLGVDVAADGGDELAIARCVGDLITMRHTSAGPSNANAVHVAGLVLEEIRRAELLAEALGSTAPVRVKIDGIGVGWGVCGILQTWATEGMHHAQIVPVVVSESTNREPEKSTLRPYRKRDEMWLCGRALMQPGTDGQDPWLRLRVDDRTAAQLSGPKKTTNSSGFTVVEPKVSMRRRGLPSPDRGEAVLLAPYEPLIGPKRKKARLVV